MAYDVAIKEQLESEDTYSGSFPLYSAVLKFYFNPISTSWASNVSQGTLNGKIEFNQYSAKLKSIISTFKCQIAIQHKFDFIMLILKHTGSWKAKLFF